MRKALTSLNVQGSLRRGAWAAPAAILLLLAGCGGSAGRNGGVSSAGGTGGDVTGGGGEGGESGVGGAGGTSGSSGAGGSGGHRDADVASEPDAALDAPDWDVGGGSDDASTDLSV